MKKQQAAKFPPRKDDDERPIAGESTCVDYNDVHAQLFGCQPMSAVKKGKSFPTKTKNLSVVDAHCS